MKTKKQIINRIFSFATLALILAFSLVLSGCSGLVRKVQAKDLMDGLNAESVENKKVDDIFRTQMADFSLKLFNESLKEGENSLISPLSVMLALSMTANGADGNTLEQMRSMLGGIISLEDLNKYLYTYSKDLQSKGESSLDIANSIWFKNDEGKLTVNKDFLQKNANYYMADAYSSEFD